MLIYYRPYLIGIFYKKSKNSRRT